LHLWTTLGLDVEPHTNARTHTHAHTHTRTHTRTHAHYTRPHLDPCAVPRDRVIDKVRSDCGKTVDHHGALCVAVQDRRLAHPAVDPHTHEASPHEWDINTSNRRPHINVRDAEHDDFGEEVVVRRLLLSACGGQWGR
jgi:hypothetical protein